MEYRGCVAFSEVASYVEGCLTFRNPGTVEETFRIEHAAARNDASSLVADEARAAFPTSERAVRTALAIRKRIATFEVPFSSRVAIALHGGKCLALTRSGKPDRLHGRGRSDRTRAGG